MFEGFSTRRRDKRPGLTYLIAPAAILALLLCASVASAQPPRNFDARAGLEATAAPTPAQQAAVAALGADVPALTARFDPATGVTRTLSNRLGYLSGPNPGAAALDVAVGFVSSNLTALGLTAADFSGYEVTDEVYSQVTGATYVYLRQRHAGIPVYNGVLQVSVNRDGRVMSVANAFLPGIAAAINQQQPGIAAAAAIESAGGHVAALGQTPTGTSAADLMWLPIERGSARLVWNFQVPTADENHIYDMTVDAVSGEVLTRFDWVDAATYRVYEQPVESPNHTSPVPPADGRTVATDPHDPGPSPLGWHDTGSTSYTITRGNNAHAYEDRDGNNLPPATDVDCGASLACDFPIDLSMNPPAYVPAAVANLFYWNNVIHDIQYVYGFDEAAGNFQVNNFGNGGAGNDDVRAEAQDNDLGGSNCNANFGTPPDGSRPRMQMFTCDDSTPEHDGDLDNAVIVHEYGHGISNRQVGGPSNVSCLNNLQQAGEGWSDWLALAYTGEVGDADVDARGIGTYLFGQPANGPGIRPRPYSTNFAVNEFTYSGINTVSVPHGVGFVWATAAWEAYWELVNAHGFDPDLSAGAAGGAGNQRAMLYVNEGMKGTACSPTFLDNRDAIIQVANDNFGGEDVCRLWAAFARRGLGASASTGGPNSLTAVDGFDLPPECVCGNGICSAGEDCNTCPADCISGTAGATCGNGICEAGDGENCLNCSDCAGRQKGKTSNRFCCGDGIAGQGAVTCADARCGGPSACTNDPVIPAPYCCGDGTCEGAENGDNCAVDCGGGTCEPKGASCTDDADCCSNKCKGGASKTCK